MDGRMKTGLLAISLAFNIFFLGAAAGGGYIWLREGAAPLAAKRPGLVAAARSLAPEERRAFRQAVQQARRSEADQVRKGRDSRAELAGLLGAPTLDRPAIDRTLEAIRNADISVRASVEKAVVDFAATLSPADRKTLVEGLETRGQMLRRGQKK